jgi:signal transduction histidine kinase
LLSVINDILDFSKIESGNMQMESRPFHLEQCLEEALSLFAAQIRIKGLEAAYLVASDIPSTADGGHLAIAPDPDQPDRKCGQIHVLDLSSAEPHASRSPHGIDRG